MPELPEVETTRRGIVPHVVANKIDQCFIHNSRLRYEVPADLPARVQGEVVKDIQRRGKYLLFRFDSGSMMVHLGMSGSLRLVTGEAPREKHDHLEWLLSSGAVLRYRDPRRFGLVFWVEGDPFEHPLLRSLGPEPLEPEFTHHYLHKMTRGRKAPIKNVVMNSRIVVGVGNIYANEALFMAGIRPLRMANQISLARYDVLVQCIKTVLSRAIEQGGTTLRDFVGGDGQPGYFAQTLAVYGRGGQPCLRCGNALKEVRLLQRTTVYCSHCQT